jgi:hypothetical protein
LTFENNKNQFSIMETKEKIESVVYHQTQCLNAIDDLRNMIATHHEAQAINKLRDLEKELTRLTRQLRDIEDSIMMPN